MIILIKGGLGGCEDKIKSGENKMKNLLLVVCVFFTPTTISCKVRKGIGGKLDVNSKNYRKTMKNIALIGSPKYENVRKIRDFVFEIKQRLGEGPATIRKKVITSNQFLTHII